MRRDDPEPGTSAARRDRGGSEPLERHPVDHRRRRRPLFGRWWFLVLAAAVIQFVPWPAALADAVYLRGTLPLWTSLTAPLNDLSGRSLSALLLLSLIVVSGVALLADARTRRAALRGLGGVVAVLALSFPFVFGLGYHTTRLEERLVAVNRAETEVVGGAVAEVADEAGAQAPQTASEAGRQRARRVVLAALQGAQPPTDSSDPVIEPSTDMALEPSSPAAAAAACLEEYLPNVVRGPLASVPQRVKAMPAGWLLTIGFSGVVSPWLLEPHIDPALPGPAALAVAMHELAHTAGFAREAEAEAVALLAGLACDDRRVRYAAALRAATSFANELSSDTRDDYVASWPAVAVADAESASAIARNHRSRLASDVATRVYDTYLSSQGTGGMSDYARATDLLVLGLVGSAVQGETTD